MSVFRSTRVAGNARAAMTAVAAALVMLAALVGTAGAVAGPTRLLDPSVSSRSVVAGSAVTFAVTYRNREGSAPDRVSLLVDGAAVAMHAPGSDTSWKDGVRYQVSRVLVVGSHVVAFEAADTRKFSDTLGAGSVVVQAAGAGGTTGSTPPPSTTPRPSPSPTKSPVTTAGGAGSGGTSPTRGTGATGGDTGSSGEVGDTSGAGTIGGSGSNAGTDSTDASGSAGPTDIDSTPGLTTPASQGDRAIALGSTTVYPRVGDASLELGLPTDPSSTVAIPGLAAEGRWAGGSGAGDSGPVGAGGQAGLDSALPAALGGPAIPAEVRLAVAVIGTTGAVTIAMAFMFFGKRRRDEEQTAPDEVLEAAAARDPGLPASAALVPATLTPTPAPEAEMLMPRWRRPSLLEARKSDPIRNGASVTTLSFEHGVVRAIDGLERRRIRYRLVSLLDGPDEFHSRELGLLDQGDEVQLVERSGLYWSVLCPDGRRGWVHKMVLGEIVATPRDDDPARTAEQDDLSSLDDVDSDVLEAYLAARRGVA